MASPSLRSSVVPLVAMACLLAGCGGRVSLFDDTASGGPGMHNAADPVAGQRIRLDTLAGKGDKSFYVMIWGMKGVGANSGGEWVTQIGDEEADMFIGPVDVMNTPTVGPAGQRIYAQAAYQDGRITVENDPRVPGKILVVDTGGGADDNDGDRLPDGRRVIKEILVPAVSAEDVSADADL